MRIAPTKPTLPQPVVAPAPKSLTLFSIKSAAQRIDNAAYLADTQKTGQGNNAQPRTGGDGLLDEKEVKAMQKTLTDGGRPQLAALAGKIWAQESRVVNGVRAAPVAGWSAANRAEGIQIATVRAFNELLALPANLPMDPYDTSISSSRVRNNPTLSQNAKDLFEAAEFVQR